MAHPGKVVLRLVLAEGTPSVLRTASRGLSTSCSRLEPMDPAKQFAKPSKLKTGLTSRIQRKSTLPLRNISIPITAPTQHSNVRQRVDYEDKAMNLKKLLYLDIPPFVKANPYNNDYLPRLDVEKFINMSQASLDSFYFKRKTKTEQLSQFLSLHTPRVENRSPTEQRPLVLLFPWLMSKPRAVAKYASIYTSLGLDVLQVSITPVDLLLPLSRSQVAAQETLDFLSERKEYDKLFAHCMSVGTYMLHETLATVESNEARYLVVRDRLVGSVHDSPCELPGLREGVARSVTDHRAGQEGVMRALESANF